MGGFEVLAGVARYNSAASAAEFDAWLDRHFGGPHTREGIPVEVWRALPDSPGA
jgi:hypothetical protein